MREREKREGKGKVNMQVNIAMSNTKLKQMNYIVNIKKLCFLIEHIKIFISPRDENISTMILEVMALTAPLSV